MVIDLFGRSQFECLKAGSELQESRAHRGTLSHEVTRDDSYDVETFDNKLIVFAVLFKFGITEGPYNKNELCSYPLNEPPFSSELIQ